MKKKLFLICSIILGLNLVACSSTSKDLTAPCPDFGKRCTQTPINSWGYFH